MIKRIKYEFDIKFILLLHLCILCIVLLLSDFNGLYGQDSYAYYGYTKRLFLFFHGGVFPEDYAWSIGYPLLSALLALVVQNINLALMMITITSSLFIIFYLYKITTLFFPENKTEVCIFLFLFFCLSPFLFRSSIVLMSDLTTTACTVASFYYCLAFRFKQKYLYSLLFSLFFCLGILTRHVAGLVMLPMLLFFIYASIETKNIFHLSSLVLVAVPLLSLHYYFKGSNATNFLHHYSLGEWSFMNFFRHEFVTADGHRRYEIPNLLYVFSNFIHPGFILTGIVFLVYIKKNSFSLLSIRIAMISILIYALFLAGIPSQNYRFLILTYPLILLLFFSSFLKIIEIELVKKYYRLIITIVVLTQIIFITKAFYPFYKYNKMEKEIAMTVKKYPANKLLYSSGLEGVLEVYGAKFNSVSIYSNRINQFKTNSLLLLNPEEIKAQWQGKNPGLNFEYAQTHYKLITLENLPGGWKLYEIR